MCCHLRMQRDHSGRICAWREPVRAGEFVARRRLRAAVWASGRGLPFALLFSLLAGCGGGSAVVDPAPAAAGPPPVTSNPGNAAPTIAGTPATSVTAGNVYRFQPVAADTDGDPLVFSIQNRPAWSTFDAATGLLTGTPADADAGVSSNVIISVSDGHVSVALQPFTITAAPASSGTPAGNGNFDPAFVPSAGDFIYVDLNRAANGTGSSAADPTNRLPAQIGDRTQLLFNSDSGVQTIPCQNDGVFVVGDDIQISSYGSGRATISGYQVVRGGWTQVGTSNVWQRSFAGGTSGAGPVVGSVIDLSSTRESPTGDVLDWRDLGEAGNRIGIFRSDPTVLATGAYAYDWQQQIMYVNVGADPNQRRLGISCVGYFVNTLAGAAPSRVTMHNLRLIGFARDGANIIGNAGYWHIYDNELYATGGMYSATSNWYFGSGIQMSQHANNIEIDHNRIIQTFDSPITPQHFGGATGGYLHDLHFHDNFIDRWALGAVEMSDFGNNNRFSNITIEDNIAINGGKGFSRTGDTPQGYTDGIQVRGGNSSVFSSLVVRRNKINAYNSNIRIGGNNFTNPVLVDGNVLSAAGYGINNQRPASASIDATANTLCGNTVQIYDKSAASQYLNDTLLPSACAIK